MKKSRPSNFVAAVIAIFSVLFMQFAVASYTCPTMEMGDTGNASMNISSISYESMSGCDGVDMVQPNLCHAHNQVGSHSLDKPELPQVQGFFPITLTMAWSLAYIADSPLSRSSESFVLTRASAPPLAIRNCCFRI